jgi:ABC-type multidrug transport system fused ATPase/permease subunit
VASEAVRFAIDFMESMPLSGGQRLRNGIVRSLYRDPEMLIFDEATNLVDTVKSSASWILSTIWRTIKRFPQSRTGKKRLEDAMRSRRTGKNS